MYRLLNIRSNKLTRFNNLSAGTCNVCTVVKNGGEKALCKQTASCFRGNMSLRARLMFVTKRSRVHQVAGVNPPVGLPVFSPKIRRRKRNSTTAPRSMRTCLSVGFHANLSRSGSIGVFVVSDSSTVYHKAKIKNLTPEDLNFLATTNLNLSELYKLKDMMRLPRVVETHTYSNLSVIENISSKVEDNDECLEGGGVETAETVIPVDLSSDLPEPAAEETVTNER